MSQSCVYCSHPSSSRNRGSNNVLLAALHTIERYALNDRGVVGSLYDAWTDTLLSNLTVTKNLILRKDVREKPTCKLIKIDTSNRDNLLQLIGIEGDLRLSVTLCINQITQGTLLLNTCDLPTNRTIRLIHYYHVDHEEYLSDDMQVARSALTSSLLTNHRGTHIITSVRRGIDFVLVLELSENANVNEVDSLLEKLCEYLTESEEPFLSLEDQQKLNILKLTIFTQSDKLQLLSKNKNLTDICRDIHQYIYKPRDSIPLLYTLHPVKCIYFNESCEQRTFYQLDLSIIKKIEQTITPLCGKLKTIRHLFYNRISLQLSPDLQIRVTETQDKVLQVENTFKDVQRNLAARLIEFRRVKPDLSLVENALISTEIITLNAELDILHSALIELEAKARFIPTLKTDRPIESFNVADLEAADDNQESLEAKLFSLTRAQRKCFLCASNKLIKADSEKFDQLRRELIELCQVDRSFHPILADFSYCICTLDSMKIIQSITPSVVSSREMNILLIGETGVGKSTFINAFVNYLAFQSFEEAENGEPIVLIPVAFLITIGDQFHDQKIEFGQFDSNEDHNQLGQSVTQHCKSYIFDIGNHTKVRIIDTPGLGDTRGVEQDLNNIEQIFSYVTNLPYLDAICFLLKPNNTRLHALFRTCFTQLFGLLGPSARKNILFCFTNTRATFYAPGNTMALLKTMIHELPEDHRPLLGKENIFCFDSESFRYLAVVRAGYQSAIDNSQKPEFVNSWKTSVKESIRLLDRVQSCPKYQMNNYHSIKHAQTMILWLVRPMLETIRNCLRNLSLREMGDRQQMIEMEAQPVSSAAYLCTTSRNDITLLGDVWILKNVIHQYRTSKDCVPSCGVSNENLPVFYELKYRLSDKKGSRFFTEMVSIKDALLDASVAMTRFLRQTSSSSSNLFLSWFAVLVREETAIYAHNASSIINAILHNRMFDVKKKYEEDVNKNESQQEHISLNGIYELIGKILSYPLVSEQMDATRRARMQMMKEYECDVSSQYPRAYMNGSVRHQTILSH